ncbi:MAG: GIY-YIG nuclease family protein [Flavobacteriales bacterium]|nr:GIY-YIG nuclease family protein [Flavobacteriales bacterium]
MGRGKTIQIFLPDGSANGIKLAEITSAIEKAILIPRNNLQEAVKRKETAQEGIYFLFGTDDKRAKPLVYIGQTKEGIKRIKNHDQNKDFWNYAILIISKTKSFTKTHIEFLEELTIRMAKESNRFEFENNVSPKHYEIPESLEADLLDSFDTIKILTTTLGFPLFETNIKTVNNFYLKGRGIMAEGNLTNDGFIVYAGSQVKKETTPSCHSYLINKREMLLSNGIISEQTDYYQFEEDFIFDSCSTAGGVILGRSTNGWTKWKNTDGQTLDEVKRK